MVSHRNNVERRISYYMPVTASNEDEHATSAANHWHSFTWEAGRYIAEWVSREYGNIQCWGIDHAEAMSVVRHALAHMGVSEDQGQWVLSESKNSRFGKVATVRAVFACARSDSSGPGVTKLMANEVVYNPY